MLLAVSLHHLLPLLPLTPSGFVNGMVEVSEPGALNRYTLFCQIPLTLFVSRNLTLNYLILSRSRDSLFCDLIAPHTRSGIFSTDVTHASGGVIIFVRQGLSFSELSTSSLSSLDPYSDYIGVKISLNDSSSLSLLNVYALPFAPLRRIAEPTPFLHPFFPSLEISLFWLTLIAITPFGTQKVLRTPVGRKYWIGSFPLTFSFSMTLTYLLFSIFPLAVAPPLTSALLPPLSPYLAIGRFFRTWVLITYQFC